MATKIPANANDSQIKAAVAKVMSGLERVDAGDGLGGVFAKPDGQKFKARAKKSKEAKKQRVSEYRKEASRLAAMANKRVARLEANNLQDAPAYKGYLESGGGKFSVKGKTHNELQREVSRMQKFIVAKTSTVTGVNTYLKGIATNTGIKYTNMKDLKPKAATFFTLSNKVEEYLRTVEDMASAIGYQRIWEAVNEYVQTARIDMADANLSIDDMVLTISKAIAELERPENIKIGDLKAYEATNWYKLKKE